VNKDSYIKKAYDLGFQYEKDYHGCAQSTIAAVQDSLGLRNDFVFKAASGLAGGCGGLGDGMCGGYSGGSMVMCTFFGRRRDKFDNDNEYKECSNKMVKLLHDKFIEEYGSIICSEIQKSIFGRHYNLLDQKEKDLFEKDGAHIDKCTAVVGNASAWAIEILLNEIEKKGLNSKDFEHLLCKIENNV